MLFVGVPLFLENFSLNYFKKSSNIFVRKNNWLLGFLTNKSKNELKPQIIVCYKDYFTVFSIKESFKKDLPLIFLSEKNENNLFVDYSISLNFTNRKEVYQLFFILLIESVN